MTSFCKGILENPSAARNQNAPAPLSAILSVGDAAELNSVCSCLVDRYEALTPASGATTSTCPTVTRTVSVPHTLWTATARSSIVTVTVSKTTSVGTVTDTVTVSKTASGTTVTDTITVSKAASGATVTETTTVSKTASSTTITDTVTATSTDTITVMASTVTLSASTVTVTVTASSSPPPAFDQQGCTAIYGASIEGYVLYCNTGAASGSFTAGTNQGYNIEDCASQCFDDPDNIDCLGATYTPPDGGAFSIIDGHLQPGTCTFYEFVSDPIASSGTVLAIFENSFSGRKA
jgi:hypothetical protein